MSKKHETLSSADKAWINKNLTKTEQGICFDIWGGIPLHDEDFIKNNTLFINIKNAKKQIQ